MSAGLGHLALDSGIIGPRCVSKRLSSVTARWFSMPGGTGYGSMFFSHRLIFPE